MIEALVDGPVRHPRGWPCRMGIWGSLELHRRTALADGTHLVSVEPDESALPLSTSAGRHLVLDVDDVTEAARPGAPTLRHLDALMTFVDRLPADAALVIRCPHGVSRSTALALGLLAREVPPLRAAYLLHRLRPFACPNALLVRMWDELLGLDGDLVEVAGHFPTFTWRHGDGAAEAPQPGKRGALFSANAARPSRTSSPARLSR
jgi:predicted protein tyrosine phosphatase